MLVLAPIMCILGGIAISSTLGNYIVNLDLFGTTEKKNITKDSVAGKTYGKGGKKDDNYPYKQEVTIYLFILKVKTF